MNVVAMMQLARLFVPHMVERGHGMVMNLASAAALCPRALHVGLLRV